MGEQLISREVHLANRPSGMPSASDFSIVERVMPEPGDGEVLIRNLVLSVEPAMRVRMTEARTSIPPYRLGEVMTGEAVGEVVASRSPDVLAGQVVLHDNGWREYAIADAGEVQVVDADSASPSTYLGLLGVPGMTAHAGLLDVAGMQRGEVVFVSGAAGAVGSLAGQFARLHGASKVIGSAGSAEKVKYLTERLGFDAALNYKDGPVGDQLRELAPDGIDVYFDNVGGDHLEAALDSMRPFGRVAVCGAISQYNATEPQPGPRNLMHLVTKRITIRGFLVLDHYDRWPKFAEEVGGWARNGDVHLPETVVDGIAAVPEAFIGLFHGSNLGKMTIRLSDQRLSR